MTPIQQEELKERAGRYLKRVGELSNSATKTAVVGLSALTIIWFSQIRPQYHLLLDDVYTKFKPTYEDFVSKQEDLNETSQRIKARQTKETKRNGETLAVAEQNPDSAYKLSPLRLLREESSRRRTVQIQSVELQSLLNTVSFDVFGLRLPVPALYAAVVWTALLLFLLLYLAQARSTIWKLCADSIVTLKQLGRDSNAISDIAGSGPLWMAPPPSRPGKDDSPTVEDLRAAFGWNRLQTLPSIGATAAFLLLVLLQLTVTAEGLSMVSSAETFTRNLITANTSNQDFTETYNPVVLKSKITKLAEDIASGSGGTQSSVSPFVLKQRLTELTVSPAEVSLISLALVAMLGATFLLMVWWFRPWSAPERLTDKTSLPRQLAIYVLVSITVIAGFSLAGWLKPGLGLSIGQALTKILPTATLFLTGSVVAFCMLELLTLARSSGQLQQSNQSGKDSTT